MSAYVYNVWESALFSVCDVVTVRGEFAWSLYLVASLSPFNAWHAHVFCLYRNVSVDHSSENVGNASSVVWSALHFKVLLGTPSLRRLVQPFQPCMRSADVTQR